jgi:hypothetical protein
MREKEKEEKKFKKNKVRTKREVGKRTPQEEARNI